MKAFLAATAGLTAASAEPSVAVVAGTGVSLVFLILILLTLLITVQGKFFDSLQARKKAKTASAKAEAAPAPAPAAPVKAPPFVEEGIPEELVAVIAAAVAASSNGQYTLRSLTRASSGRGNWGAAGAISGTEPF